uniref:Myb/SANT-like DNA-binding domain-containing protein n=1 Tax=Gadus morhua TaxID=8049 RepID=A0A8C5CQ19_GADMO
MAENVDLTFSFKWSKEHTAQLIKLRGENDELFTGVKHSASVAWGTILEKIGLQGYVTPLQAKKKWDNLKKIYKDCKYPGSGEGVGGKPTAATWPWFVLMDEVLGQRHSTNPPVLIASIPEDTPGPSTAVVDLEVEEKDEEESRSRRKSRKRDREGEMFELIKEDMRLNREAEERRAQESRERMDRFFSILERIADK